MTMPGSLVIVLSLFAGYIFVYVLNMPKLNELRLLFFKVMAGVSVCEKRGLCSLVSLINR